MEYEDYENDLFGYEEHLRDSIPSTMAELDEEEARLKGARNPDRCWILTGNDVWHRNPYYEGVETTHPEFDFDDIPF